MEHPDNIIPQNSKGAKTDTSSSITFNTPEQALQHYQVCKKRLLTISAWHDLAGSASATFILTDAYGVEVDRPLQQSDFFKINIPAPGTETGDGFDWVQVEALEENASTTEDWQYIMIKVRPASNPANKQQSTAHFFNDDANSFFMIKRVGKVVSAEVHGRNEQPNTNTETFTDKIRNVVVAIGAILGISKAQWKSLTDGLIAEDK